jgi:hypothetical protein
MAYCHPDVANVAQLLLYIVAGQITIGFKYLLSVLIYSIVVTVVRLTCAPRYFRRSSLPTRTLIEPSIDKITLVLSML